MRYVRCQLSTKSCRDMRETRHAVLQFIKRWGSATVNDLAAELAISPVTVRHHLYALMADNLVERVPIRRGVGRPQYGYSLTDAGRRQFPSRYHVLTTHLLNVLKNVESTVDVEELLEVIVRQLLGTPIEIDGLTPEERLKHLQAHFHSNDIPITLHLEDGEDARLTMSCPYYYVSQHHPELCHIDAKVLGDILQLPVERTGCLLDGNKSCTFSIKLVENITLDEQSALETGSD
jgi:DeoR family suf operon transcriptional repressor